MKKIVLILTSLIMIMGLTACGRQVNTAESSEASGTATPEAEIAQSPSYQTANPDNVITVNSTEHVSFIPCAPKTVRLPAVSSRTPRMRDRQSNG